MTSTLNTKARNRGVLALLSVISNEKNVKNFEHFARKASGGDAELYENIVLRIVECVVERVPLREIAKSIDSDSKMFLWNHAVFNDSKAIILEEDTFIENPYEVVEGVLQCNACESRRVVYYQKQVRSSDEPMTTFATCFACGKKWVYNG